MAFFFHRFYAVLLLCLGLLPASGAGASTGAGRYEEPRLKESESYYKNGNLRCKIISIYRSNGSEEKTITEVYRRDGTKKHVSLTSDGDLYQYTRYNKQGRMRYERSYHYDYSGHLHCVETRKANGDRQTWTEPSPEPATGYFLNNYTIK